MYSLSDINKYICKYDNIGWKIFVKDLFKVQRRLLTLQIDYAGLAQLGKQRHT